MEDPLLTVFFNAARHVLVERCDESRCPNTVRNSHAPRLLPDSELLQEELEREYHEPLPPETPSTPQMKHMQSGTKSPPKTNTAGSSVQELHEVDEDGEHERQVPGLHAEAGQWLEEANGAGSTVIQRTTAKWPPRPCPRCSALRQRPTLMMVTPHDRINLQLRHLQQRIVPREDLAPQPCHRDERGAMRLGRQRGKEQLTIQQLEPKWLS